MFKILDEACKPSRGSKFSACVDLRAREDMQIEGGKTVLIPLGVSFNIDEFIANSGAMFPTNFKSKHYLQLMLRSSLSKELIIANGVGVIDLDYKDEIMIRVHNPSRGYGSVKITKGQRVAQITMLEHKSYLFGIETEDERVGGFGSTNQKEESK